MSADNAASFEDVAVLRETEDAVLVLIDNEEVWIPKKVIRDESEVWSMTNAGPGTLVVEEWFAEKKGLT